MELEKTLPVIVGRLNGDRMNTSYQVAGFLARYALVSPLIAAY